MGEKEEEKTIRKIIILLTVAAILIVSVFTNDLHQLVFRFPNSPHFRIKITAMVLFYGDSGMDLDLSDRDGNHSDQKKQNSGKETVLAASDSGNIASGVEYRKYTPPAFHQNHCRGYDGSVLSFNGGNFSGLYIMWIDTDQ